MNDILIAMTAVFFIATLFYIVKLISGQVE